MDRKSKVEQSITDYRGAAAAAEINLLFKVSRVRRSGCCCHHLKKVPTTTTTIIINPLFLLKSSKENCSIIFYLG